MITLPLNYNKQYYNKWLYRGIAFFLLCLVLKMCSGNDGFNSLTSARMSSPMISPQSETNANLRDSPPPKPQYIPAVKIPVHIWDNAFDSIGRFVLPELGKSMSVDQADQYKKFFYRQINSILTAATVDSILLNSKKR